MVKTKVKDLAEEFGIEPDRLLELVREMGVTARSVASALDDTQVAAIRVRWEREKRKPAEPAAKKTTRRKSTK
ncbi:MAG TPA: translation initiation factor IF-2 N-terminal domain-containing protein, partial [Gemmatimonadales bacterium]|nr:translation initiation factor IF-2 N-terminal domain-containing protein [Gemmatimonadales bacterium]